MNKKVYVVWYRDNENGDEYIEAIFSKVYDADVCARNLVVDWWHSQDVTADLDSSEVGTELTIRTFVHFPDQGELFQAIVEEYYLK